MRLVEHIISFNKFDKLNNTGAQMLDSIYHIFEVKALRFCHIFAALLQPSIHNVTKICKPLVVY